jgi:hypothetical protein
MRNYFVGAVVVVVPMLATASAAAQSRCTIADTTVPAAGTELFTAATGGTAIAKFMGSNLGVRLSDLPADLANGRVRVKTGDGRTPYLRVEGFAAAKAFRLFARQSIALIPRHVWLTKGLELDVSAVKDDQLEITHKILGTRGDDGSPQKLTGRIACSVVGLHPPGMDAVDSPQGARLFHMRNDEISLYDSAQGSILITLKLGEARKVFWSTEASGGYVHVNAPGDITIDAWVRASDLEPLVHGEVFDMSSLEPRPLKSKTLALQSAPTMLTAASELSMSAKAEASAPGIGVVETGARFYTMEVSTQWTSVIPSDLAIMPVDGGGFWVKTSTLPKP